MRVLKLTASDGSVFYTDHLSDRTVNDWLDSLERQASKRHGGLQSVEIVKMTDDEYHAIPATNSAADLFAIRDR